MDELKEIAALIDQAARDEGISSETMIARFIEFIKREVLLHGT